MNKREVAIFYLMGFLLYFFGGWMIACFILMFLLQANNEALTMVVWVFIGGGVLLVIALFLLDKLSKINDNTKT